jgi:hypothetical protein
MNFIERIDFIEKMPFEKQLVVAVMSSERTYQEIVKIFPNGLKQRPFFRKSIDILWAYLQKQSTISDDELKILDLEVFRYVKDEFDYKEGEWIILYHSIITSLARNLNLTIGMIRRGEETGESSANVVEGTRHVFGTIYETPNGERIIGIKEKEWLTKAIYLVVETNEIPTNYEWFIERIPEYERGKIYKNFKDID